MNTRRTSEPLSIESLGPVEVPAAYEVIADRLRRAIHLGMFTQGERLPPERELAILLGVSRVTLRAALKTLEGAGLVVRSRGSSGGTEVAASAADNPALRAELVAHIAENALVTEFRAVVESSAAELAAQRRSDEDLRLLAAAGDELDTVDSVSTFRRADGRFHLLIARATGNPLLEQAISDTRERMFASIDVLPYRVIIERTRIDHRAILAAIVSRESAPAATLMGAHVRASHVELREVLGIDPEPR